MRNFDLLLIVILFCSLEGLYNCISIKCKHTPCVDTETLPNSLHQSSIYAKRECKTVNRYHDVGPLVAGNGLVTSITAIIFIPPLPLLSC